jgi:hypothetical protein
MDFIASLLVHKPLNILVVALIFLAGFVALRFTSLGQGKHAAALLVPAAGWAVYSAWEWVVMTRTPEANIRFDLLVVWPILLVLSVWFILRSLR